MNKFCSLLLIFVLMFYSNSCSSQESNNLPQKNNRKAVVAGSFYPATEAELRADLKEYFALSIVKSDPQIRAILSPHAGYVFSGKVAASAFASIPSNKKFDNIFVITSSHRVAFNGASVYVDGNYETPLGEITVNRELGNDLIKNNPVFSGRTDAHINDHSLEVQLPFLQYHIKTPINLVPIVIGTDNPDICKSIANALKPYFTKNNLFIISTDFSHFPSYTDAIEADNRTANSLLNNNPQALIDSLVVNNHKKIQGLSTSMCGASSVLTLLYLTEANDNINYSLLEYRNSGDSRHGDKNRVVGYWAVKVTDSSIINKTENSIEFSIAEKKQMLQIARKTVEEYVKNKSIPSFDKKDFGELITMPMGAFVSLYKEGKLRGCIGQFQPTNPLYEVLVEMTVASATRDTRFLPVTSSELNDIDIEISVLTPMEKINDVSKIELGKHGIYIIKGNRGGTFLPQVATDTGWTLEEFLGYCARDKAGIGWDGWKDADIYIYEAIVFSEKDIK